MAYHAQTIISSYLVATSLFTEGSTFYCWELTWLSVAEVFSMLGGDLTQTLLPAAETCSTRAESCSMPLTEFWDVGIYLKT